MIRQTASKVRISEIINSDASKFNRVNVIAIVISKQKLSGYGSIVVDDKTSRIELREFETDHFERLNIGDIIMVIGRVRQFNSKYIVPEIVKKVDISWLKCRQAELKIFEQNNETLNNGEYENDIDRILNFIRKNDSGYGVDIDFISAKSGVKDSKELLATLIKDGSVFESGKGKIKVLD